MARAHWIWESSFKLLLPGVPNWVINMVVPLFLSPCDPTENLRPGEVTCVNTRTASEWSIAIEVQVCKTPRFISLTFYSSLSSRFLVESVSYSPGEKVKYTKGYGVRLNVKTLCLPFQTLVPRASFLRGNHLRFSASFQIIY